MDLADDDAEGEEMEDDNEGEEEEGDDEGDSEKEKEVGSAAATPMERFEASHRADKGERGGLTRRARTLANVITGQLQSSLESLAEVQRQQGQARLTLNSKMEHPSLSTLTTCVTNCLKKLQLQISEQATRGDSNDGTEADRCIPAPNMEGLSGCTSIRSGTKQTGAGGHRDGG